MALHCEETPQKFQGQAETRRPFVVRGPLTQRNQESPRVPCGPSAGSGGEGRLQTHLGASRRRAEASLCAGAGRRASTPRKAARVGVPACGRRALGKPLTPQELSALRAAAEQGAEISRTSEVFKGCPGVLRLVTKTQGSNQTQERRRGCWRKPKARRRSGPSPTTPPRVCHQGAVGQQSHVDPLRAQIFPPLAPDSRVRKFFIGPSARASCSSPTARVAAEAEAGAAGR